MKQYKIIALLLMTASFATAQNNAIFNGGSADGWTRNGVTQASNNIFVGGAGDGWQYNSFAQAANNIFKGGDGDGWTFAAYAQTGNAIFIGGDGDGWANNSFLQAGNSIFKGGNGDGWSYLTYLQTGNAIFAGGSGDGWNYLNFLQESNNVFTGGQGDGWASTYRPLGPLPVTLLSFTAEKQGTSSLLKWQTSKEEGAAYFDVERSTDAVHFEKKGAVAAAGTTTVATDYAFTDLQPVKGYNYYRLKQVDKNGAFVYTPVRMLVFDVLTLQKLKAYPVPATTFLTIELPAEMQNENAVLNVSNTLGVMVQQVKLPSNRVSNKIVLSLGALPAGAYTLQVSSASFNGSQVVIKQ